MKRHTHRYAVVTGAACGIGSELAAIAVRNGFDLVVAADDGAIHASAQRLREGGASVKAVQTDLSTAGGVDALLEAALADGRAVDALFVITGAGDGMGFLDADLDKAQHTIDACVSGTLRLVHAIGRGMRERGSGRILLASPPHDAGGAVLQASARFLERFAGTLRREVEPFGVSITRLTPGAASAGVASAETSGPSVMAEIVFEATMRGDGTVAGDHTRPSALASAI